MATQKADDKRLESTVSGFRVQLDRLYAVGHRPLAVFSVDDGRFAVHGIQVLDSQKGPFVQMPQTSYRNKDQTIYRSIFHPITAEARQELYGTVMDLYEQARAEEALKNAEEESTDEIPDQGPNM